MSKFISRFILAIMLTSGVFVTAGVPQAHADRYGECQERTINARDKLERDIARHGRHSHQARHDRHELQEARRWCHQHHAG